MNIYLHSRIQFGYHSDSLRYAEILSENFSVTYSCLDQGHKRVSPKGFVVEYANGSSRSKVLKFCRLIAKTWNEYSNHDVSILVYHPGISLLAMRCKKRAILDIRSMSMSSSRIKRGFWNLLLFCELRLFKHINVVSEDVARRLKLEHFRVVPVGADRTEESFNAFSQKRKNGIENEAVFTYVGTFENRDIDVLVKGFNIAASQVPVTLKLVLVGRGTVKDHREIVAAIDDSINNLNVSMPGYLIRSEIDAFLNQTDCGIVHVPTDGRYAGHPSTKLFEYMAHGIPVMGSNYDFNCRFITRDVGFIYNFNADSISDCILRVLSNYNSFDSLFIRAQLNGSEWETIVKEKLVPVLMKFSKS